MEKPYDHSNLQPGDTAAYARLTGYGVGSWQVQTSKVVKLTATQIVLEDGTRFVRATGRRVGDKNVRYYASKAILVDPKGPEVVEAWSADLARHVVTALGALSKIRVRDLDTLADLLASAQSVINQAHLKRTEFQERIKNG